MLYVLFYERNLWTFFGIMRLFIGIKNEVTNRRANLIMLLFILSIVNERAQKYQRITIKTPLFKDFTLFLYEFQSKSRHLHFFLWHHFHCTLECIYNLFNNYILGMTSLILLFSNWTEIPEIKKTIIFYCWKLKLNPFVVIFIKLPTLLILHLVLFSLKLEMWFILWLKVRTHDPPAQEYVSWILQ